MHHVIIGAMHVPSLFHSFQLNPHVNAFHRNFVNEVKRCDEMERKLRFFEEQVIKEKGLNRILNSVSLENAASNSASININELEVSGMQDEIN
jgi:V-type H+-transporting ATPase subunit a